MVVQELQGQDQGRAKTETRARTKQKRRRPKQARAERKGARDKQKGKAKTTCPEGSQSSAESQNVLEDTDTADNNKDDTNTKDK